MRIRGTLHRDAGRDAVAHVIASGYETWPGAGRVPAAPAIGLAGRLVVPLRWRGALVGSVMVIDDDATLSDDEVARVGEFAIFAAAQVAADLHSAEQGGLVNQAQVRSWLGDDPDARARGRKMLAECGLLPDYAPRAGLRHRRAESDRR